MLDTLLRVLEKNAYATNSCCAACGHRAMKVSKLCQKCGAPQTDDTKELERPYAESGETGAEASTNEEKAKSEKVASLDYDKLPNALKFVAGAASLAAGTYGAVKLNKLMKPPVEKTAAARLGNPVFNIRKPKIHGDVKKALARMSSAAKKIRMSKMKASR